MLDLGEQPSSELFPAADDPGPDPLLPLRWLCAGCGLAQLAGATTSPRSPWASSRLRWLRSVRRRCGAVADGVLPERGTVGK